jgi:hypothetical protein
MRELDRTELDVRLQALYRDLDAFPSGVYCPWPVARVFNELMRHAKRELADDPVIGAIASLKAAQADDGETETSTALVGAVRVLVAQMQAAIASSNGGAAESGSSG